MVVAVKVPKKKGEIVRRQLIQDQLIRSDLIIQKDNDFLYFPLRSEPKDNLDFQLVKRSFMKRTKKADKYKDLLDLPGHLKQLLPTSFDIIGTILLLKLPDELLDFKEKIGKALLKTHSHVETICLIKPVAGELRTRPVEVIAGKPTTQTIHKEYGLMFHVDVEKTYFSPRLAVERFRIAGLVQPDEIVVDMFTGVAPFPVMIARYARPKRIIAVDKNRVAIDFAQRNIIENKVLDTVDVFCEDAVNIEQILDIEQVRPDRVLMNLPFQSFEFFPYALRSIRERCMINYYEILNEEDIDSRLLDLKKIAASEGVTLEKMQVHRIKTYAPREFYIAIDITAQKNR